MQNLEDSGANWESAGAKREPGGGAFTQVETLMELEIADEIGRLTFWTIYKALPYYS